MTYLLSEMETLTGAPRRAIQFWTDSGVIKADVDREGRGVHRRYSRSEAIIACAVRPFAKRRLTIGELIPIGTAIRKMLKEPNASALIDEAITGDALVYLVFSSWGKGRSRMSVLTPGYVEPDAGLVPKHTTSTLAKDLLDEAVGRLGEPDSMAWMVLLNPYVKGLAQ